MPKQGRSSKARSGRANALPKLATDFSVYRQDRASRIIDKTTGMGNTLRGIKR